SKSLVSTARTKISTTRASSAASLGVIVPCTPAVVIAAIVPARAAAPRTTGTPSLTGRAARRNDALEAEPQRRSLTFERELDGSSGQRLGFAVEHQLGRFRRLVAHSHGPPLRVTRPALPEPAIRVAAHLFLHGIYRHRLVLAFMAPTSGCRVECQSSVRIR